MTQRFALDLRSLALFRVGIAVSILVDLALRLGSLDLYGPHSPLPRAQLAGRGVFTLLALGDAPAFVAAHFAVQALVAVALLVGWRTRAATWLSYALAISLHMRLTPVLFAGDQLLRALLFWGAFLPLGARLSVDARASSPGRTLAPGTHASLASAALVTQVALAFFAAGVVKLTSSSWRAGEALDVILRADFYAMPLGRALREAAPMLLPAMTYAAFALELGAPLLLFARAWKVRTIGALLIAYLMVGIGLMMTVGHFPVIAIAAVLALMPRELWRDGADASAPAPAVVAPSRARTVLLACALACVVVTSFVSAVARPLQERYPIALSALALTQSWGMFGHPEGQQTGFVRVLGVTAPDRLDDLLTRAPAQLETAPPPFAELAPFRERRLYEDLARGGAITALYPSTAQWLCARERARGTPIERARLELAEWTVGDRVAVRVLFDVPCAPQ